ncbi:hypothetical protein SAMN05519103_09558 [Rhizobiales bacterium GAS113]|nr:hypothetical protein SAMN05519103_09558 [Rhizobiales bacterium GAS113]
MGWGRSIALVAMLCVGGCASPEAVRFSAQADQTAIVRDGSPAIISRKKTSIVLVKPASRQMEAGRRPVFVVAATNLTSQPMDLKIENITVGQELGDGTTRPLPVVTYDQLVTEERTRQVVGALLVGAAAAANSYSASRAGYGTIHGTAYTPHGISNVTMNYYDPTAAAIAQVNASSQNEALIAGVIERGQQNLATLENSVLKDNTVMPGEWIGGQVYFSPPQGEMGQPKHYAIAISLGGEVHTVEVTQEPIRR